jgi:hypothetical protein
MSICIYLNIFSSGAELSLLSKLLGVEEMQKDAKDDAFKLAIFDDPVPPKALRGFENICIIFF